MKTKLFTLLVALIASIGSMFAWQYVHVKVGDLYYNFDTENKIAQVTSENNTYPYWSENITIARIPTTVSWAWPYGSPQTYNVTSISDYAFDGCSGLTSVTIPNSVTSIGVRAFSNCPNLKSIKIPNSVTSIKGSTFKNCTGLTSIEIPKSITSISDYAFDGCSGLTKVITTDLTAWCNIAFVTRTANPLYYAKHLYLNDTEITNLIIPNSVKRIENNAFAYCQGITSVTIPNSVRGIGSGAFYECVGLTFITIPNSVISIGSSAFNKCTGLTSVTITNGVTSIGEDAFAYCQGLTSVTIPNSVTSIEKQAFSNCTGLTSVTIPTSVTSIGENAFDRYTITELHYGGTLLEWMERPWGQYFYSYTLYINDVALTDLIIPNNVTAIGNAVFSGCRSLTSVTIHNNVTSIGQGAFSGCTGLTSIIIPNSITSIENSTFAYCRGLTSIEIPNSVTSIGDRAFYYCTGLISIELPHSVTSIGQYVFSICSNLTSIYVPCGELGRFQQMLPNDKDKVQYNTSKYNLTISPSSFGNVEFSEQVMLCDKIVTLTPVSNYGYHFAQWSDGNTDNPRTLTLTQDTTFTAEFAKNTYTITTESNNSEWGTANGGQSSLYLDEIEISATANYGYHFASWDDGNTQNPRTVTITADKTYTATFAKNTYSLSVQSSNTTQGSVSGAGTFEYLAQKQITATANYGYHFTQWSDGNSDNPRTFILTQDTIFTAEFAIDQYRITTQATNGTITGGGSYDYGTQINLTATANEHYHFVSWSDGELNATRQITVTEDKTYTAIFEKDKFLVLFLDENGTELKRDSIEYGEMPIAPANPTKVSTAQYDYLFYGWTPSVDIVTQAATYTATYTSSIRSYIVTFVNDDNSIISMQSYKYGEFPALPATPTKTATAEYTYTFAGWDPAVVAVTGDATYRATFNATKNSYTITWQNEDGSLIDQTTVEYGVVPTHADPVKQNTAEYTYTFAGWTPNVVAVTGDATYKATFNATKNSYTITWQNEDGSLIDQTTVEYGLVPTHADPVKQNTAEYTYTFAGWTPNVVAVTGDATYRATFNATKNSYTITWQNEDGSLIDQTTVEYGLVPTHADPVKQNTAEFSYTFAGWTPEVVAVTGDATYKATFNATKNSYTITWQNEDGSLIDQTTVEYGVVPTHADPVKQNTAEYTYTFAGWTPNVVAVTGDATYRATFNATKNSYTITWQNEDGSLIDQTTVEFGIVPTHADPVKQNTAEYTYTFAGWDPEVVVVTGDATYRATFNSEVNMYSITSNTINGEVVGIGVYAYGTEVELEAIPADGYAFNQWSDGVTENPRTIIVTGDAEYTALFTSTEGIEDVYGPDPVQKVIIDNKVYILRGDKKFTLHGQEVK